MQVALLSLVSHKNIQIGANLLELCKGQCHYSENGFCLLDSLGFGEVVGLTSRLYSVNCRIGSFRFHVFRTRMMKFAHVYFSFTFVTVGNCVGALRDAHGNNGGRGCYTSDLDIRT